MPSEPTLSELKDKLAEEEDLYAELLEKLDTLSAGSAVRAPYDQDGMVPELLAELNRSSALLAPTPDETQPAPPGPLARVARRFVEPEIRALRHALDEQRAFNSNLIQFLNRFAETTNRAAAAHAEFVSTLVRFAQRIDRLADAKDRLYASLGNTRADLLLEAMDKRLETVRLGLRRMTGRVDGMETSLTVARAELRGVAGRMDRAGEPARDVAPASAAGFEPEHYLAFEERFRGSSDELSKTLGDYVSYFESLSPVLDVGCGRGEFLQLLKDAGIEAIGIDGNREMVHACREKGLTAEVADLLDYVADAASASVGGIFAAQVVEHLPPALIRKLLGDCYRALKRDGRLILETVNPESVTAFVGFYRDLTHQKPLHAGTLEFLLRAVGFEDVTVRMTSPVSERARLLKLTSSGGENETLNQNFEKLNAFLFGEQDYAVVATKK